MVPGGKMKKHIFPGVAALLLTGVAHACEPDVPTPKPVQELQILGAMSDGTSAR